MFFIDIYALGFCYLKIRRISFLSIKGNFEEEFSNQIGYSNILKNVGM